MAHVVVRMSCRIATSIIGLRPFIAVTGADPKQPFDSADSAADHPPDGPSDRARRVVSDGGAMGGACGDALRLRCERRRKSCDQGGRQYAVKPHATNPHCIVEGRHVAANEGFSAAVGTGAAAVCRLPGKCGKSITHDVSQWDAARKSAAMAPSKSER